MLEVLVQFPVFCCWSIRIQLRLLPGIIKSLLLLPLRLRLLLRRIRRVEEWDGGLTPHRILTHRDLK